MTSGLLAWIGKTDLDASQRGTADGPGPIARALLDRQFSLVRLLNNDTGYPQQLAEQYVTWLRQQTGDTTQIELQSFQLPSPVDHEAIYHAAVTAIEELRSKHGKDFSLTFHLSPGTPAMAAIWLLLARARYDARLIRASREQGVSDVDLPFEIALELVPQLVRRSDDRLKGLAAATPPEAPEFADIIHRSKIMADLIQRARMVALRSVPVLIEGESGTGKELLARAIHAASPRRDQPFKAVNCGAIPEQLVESELFGHERGAFTGATNRRIGLFEATHNGTLFLDEIGDLPQAAQVKLLRALQEGEILRVGSTQHRPVDVRVITATNRSLVEEVAQNRFRSDLYYRLAVGVLVLAPLRRREGDIGLLINHILGQLNREQRAADPAWKDKRVSAGAKKLLLQYHWPGNVRELFNTLTRATVWSTGETIRSSEMAQAFLPAPEASCRILDRPLGNGFDIKKLLAEVSRHYLDRAMAEAGGEKTQAARLIGLDSYQTLTNWLNKYGVSE